LNIPSLPTDNLYKFIALLGLTIVAFSIYKGYSEWDNAELSWAKVEIRLTEMGAKHKLYLGKVSEMDTLIQQLKKIPGNKATNLYPATIEAMIVIRNKAYEDLKFNQKNLVDISSWIGLCDREIEIEKMKNSRKESVVELDLLRSKLDRMKKTLGDLLKRYVRLGLVGIFISAVGFILWYIKIQKPEDILLQNEIKSGKDKKSA